MQTPKRWATPAIFLLYCLASSYSVYSNAADKSSDQYRASIQRIAGEIDSISKNLNANKKLLKTEQDRLLETEQKLLKLKADMADNSKAIEAKQTQIEELTQSLETAKQAQQDNKAALSRLIASRFKQGNVDHIQKILNQQNPYAVGRLNHYHGYFSEALQQRYQQLEKQIEETRSIHTVLQQAIFELVKERDQHTLLSKQLNSARADRAKSVARLSEKVGSSTEKLDRLKKDRARLNSLLEQIAKQAAELKRLEQQRAKELAEQQRSNATATTPVVRLPVKGGFLKQKGRLAYPLAGAAKVKYGARLPESGMRSDGVYFETKKSQPVQAIFHGRVLFADYLKGYGLLIIIDHGDDHISLYGHNELLYKRVGDTVTTGEMIAKTGVTGGLRSPGLYFEIRNNTEPVDPAIWCR
ncbi:murein hydrolase activator EnvC family protein [Arenicella xantha]|uniref:Septal ring factor EnvC (AmiA/AmiB activator) n=1 Tax=Arenicella xantha TaxID=644221 RepID=A0A395JQ24_9GAMM|nr:peptidoglycan DD-metalloendopeptidase family protein [Arenicella xantha]RBP53751.1 septal ring factor EnvC (AmiA/AmiB activator) [Arenicella xantha]